jgi:hypothetical protein
MTWFPRDPVAIWLHVYENIFSQRLLKLSKGFKASLPMIWGRMLDSRGCRYTCHNVVETCCTMGTTQIGEGGNEF